MPNYLLFLYEEPGAFNDTSPDEMQAIIQKYRDWRLRLQKTGKIVGGEKLQDGTGRLMRRTDGETSVLDGPYTESKEIIAGFFEIQAENYDQAVETARDCPHLDYGTIEIREVEMIVMEAGQSE
ncbi:MAG TPA: YciI family protein [Pyrinomonadaceae bacterium]|nr:YciI family protein [Pyrinomonadaceae bacterium]